MNHSFDVTVATDFGTDIAIFLNNMSFWLSHVIANRKFAKINHQYHDNFWIFNSLDAYAELFPYWNRKQIERLINRAVDSGLILKNNFNQTKYDRTSWYAFTSKAYTYYPVLEEQFKNALQPAPMAISRFREMENPKTGNGFPENSTPIPDSNPDSNPDNKKIPPNGCDDVFLTIQDMLDDNPHAIDEDVLKTWFVSRKKRKTPLTHIAWKRANTNMTTLVNHGLNAKDCFDRMVSNGWQGIEIKYFDQEINKNSVHNQREANEQATRAREFKAREDKRKEIEASKGLHLVIETAVDEATRLLTGKKHTQNLFKMLK